MQLDLKLTIQSATKSARNCEVVKQQQTEIRRKEHPTVADGEVRKSGHGKGVPKETKAPSRAPSCHLRTTKSDDAGRFRWCGGALNHTKAQCPAAGKTCNSCGRKGHYATMRLSSARKSDKPNRSSERRRCMEELHLVDTGADVTAVSLKDNHRDTMRPLETTHQPLTGPGQVPIDTAGYFRATVEWRNARVQENVFVIKRLREALLSRSAVESLGIVQRPLELAERQ
ncbi:hypothetical protein MTO96_037097 [Rhipicephalus appendiculatus]